MPIPSKPSSGTKWRVAVTNGKLDLGRERMGVNE